MIKNDPVKNETKLKSILKKYNSKDLNMSIRRLSTFKEYELDKESHFRIILRYYEVINKEQLDDNNWVLKFSSPVLCNEGCEIICIEKTHGSIEEKL